jgi:hypothetical protein
LDGEGEQGEKKGEKRARPTHIGRGSIGKTLEYTHYSARGK